MAVVASLGSLIEQQVQAAADEARAKFKRAVRPIYLSKTGSRVESMGSGVLIEAKGAPWLVTAAHVLDEAPQGSLLLGGYPDLIPLTLGFQATQKVEGQRTGDHVDIAVSRLPPEFAARTSHLGCVKAKDIVGEPGGGAGRTLVTMGYRISQNKVSHIAKGDLPVTIWTCTTSAIPIPGGGLRQHGGQHNFGMDYPKKMHRRSGESVPTTPPRGVSGGGIFDLGDFTHLEQLAAGTLPPAKLAGIFIETRARVLIGTKMSAVQDAIEDFP